jgi:hypothetical protein
VVWPVQGCLRPSAWHQFSEVVNTQFGPPSHSNALGELIYLKRTGLVATFDKQFNALLGCAPLLPAAQQVLIYTTNLQEPLTVDVEMWRPTSLLEATSLYALLNAEQTGYPWLQNQPGETPMVCFRTLIFPCSGSPTTRRSGCCTSWAPTRHAIPGTDGNPPSSGPMF